jgi:putative oxidoreductase
VLGLFTRPVAFPVRIHGRGLFHGLPMSFFPAINMGEAALLYCFIFLYHRGGGPWL